MKEIPPFPDGVPTAPIARILFTKLLSHDLVESEKVIDACRTHGFFYLDLQGCHEGEALLQDSESITELASEFFSLPLEVKRRYALVKGESVAGYKEAGSVKQTTSEKRADATEFLNIFKDHMHNITTSREYPEAVTKAKPIIQAFSRNAHACGMTILDTLARHLGIPPTEFTRRHTFQSPSEDQLRITRTMPLKADDDGVGLASHTDFGSVTILFNWLGGLQIKSRDPKRNGGWDYVKPLPGHAIINLGDAMVVFTNGELKSAKHRVVPAAGEQGKAVRYSLVYFVRPTDKVLMKPIDHFNSTGSQVRIGGKLVVEEGKVYNAAEWMIKRAGQMGAWNSDPADGKGKLKGKL